MDYLPWAGHLGTLTIGHLHTLSSVHALVSIQLHHRLLVTEEDTETQIQ